MGIFNRPKNWMPAFAGMTAEFVMFDIGFFELVVVAVVALLVIGPKRLPQAARTLGLWLGRIRRWTQQAQQEIQQELHQLNIQDKVNQHAYRQLPPTPDTDSHEQQ